ncbi:MAG: S1 RNA-binding domain-containing protein [Deltaproteobacteria bacterium]|nr:S1 RNA-binding domain-containing protein [Deltaproteobacteria bacterium]
MANTDDIRDQSPAPETAAPSAAPTPSEVTPSAESAPSAEAAPATEVAAASASPTPAAAPTEAAPSSDAALPSTEAAAPSSDGAAPSDAAAPLGDAPGAPADVAGAGNGAAEAGAEAGELGEDGAKKKRRRRRRKKKSAAGDVAAPGVEGAADAQAHSHGHGHGHGHADKKSHAPFLRYFKGDPNKRQAFTAGDVVAGRVAAALDGAFAVDLFGRADAYVDAWEPREIEAVEVPAAAPDASQNTDASAADGDAVSAGVEDAAPAAVGGPVSAAEPMAVAAEEAPGAEAVPAEAVAAEEAPGAEAGTAVEASGAEVAATDEASVVAPAASDAGPDSASAAEEATAADEKPAAPTVAPPTKREGDAPAAPALGVVFRGRVGSVSESGHIALVNRAVNKRQTRASIAAAREAKQRVEGVVFGFNRGGFDVLVEGVRVFCPASGMSLGTIPDPHEFLGQRLEFTVPPRKGGGQKNLVVSRKSILERGQRKARKERLKSLKVGEDLMGRVTQVRDYGAFVDIGDGVEGMVHQSELSWNRGDKPSDVVKAGDEVKVRVSKVSTEKHGRVDLSMRVHLADPWDEHAELLSPGSYSKSKVVRTAEFGAFIELTPGIDGLLHITELGKNLKHADQACKVGDELDVVVERVDKGQRRISLSKLSPADVQAIADGKLDPKDRPKSLKPGTIIEVVIEKVDHNGAQVQVKGVLGRRGRGYLPNREFGTKAEGARRKDIVQGAVISVKVAGTDRDGGLRVSIKGMEFDEERKAVKAYRKEAAKQGFGTFGDLLRAKLDK